MSDIIDKLTALYRENLISIEELEFAHFLLRLDNSLVDEIAVGVSVLSSHLNGHICADAEAILNHSIYGKFLSEYTEPDVLGMLENSVICGNGASLTPLVVEEERVYLHKFWKYEKELAEWLLEKSLQVSDITNQKYKFIENLFSTSEEQTDLQKTAVLLSLIKDLVIISGGPGTGKTFTIKKIIEAIAFKNESVSIALAAPTGKAAQRLANSLNTLNNFENLNQPVTIHKLLGAKGTTGEFRYNRDNPLPYDAVIVDEASMLDINLWIQLIRAIGVNTKLILLGDKNQLASVEAGSILGDICWKADNYFSEEVASRLENEILKSGTSSSFNDSIVLLKKSYRFGPDSGIKLLADAINEGDTKECFRILKSDQYPDVEYKEPDNVMIENMIRNYVTEPFKKMKESENKFRSFRSEQILCALRKGPFGTEYVNNLSEKSIRKNYNFSFSNEWYLYRTVMITRNSPVNKLSNGEIGICDYSGNKSFLRFEERNAEVPTSKVQFYEPAYAITVHKSQGSEYENVAVLLSDKENRVLSKELLYTSVTRARFSLLVIGSAEVISHTITRKISRKSGLKQKIWKDKQKADRGETTGF